MTRTMEYLQLSAGLSGELHLKCDCRPACAALPGRQRPRPAQAWSHAACVSATRSGTSHRGLLRPAAQRSSGEVTGVAGCRRSSVQIQGLGDQTHPQGGGGGADRGDGAGARL